MSCPEAEAPFSDGLDLTALTLAAGLAGLVAVAVTRLIERLGGLLGGLLGTLPSTIVPAALGIYAQTPDREAFVAAMCMTPVGMLINALFLWLWRALPPRLPPLALRPRVALLTGLTLGAWALAAAAAVLGVGSLRTRGTPMPAVGLSTTAAIVLVGILACLRPLPAPRGARPVGLLTLLARGSLAAVAIALSIALSAWGSPLLAGVATVFPAIFLTTMVSLWLAQGEAVPSGAVGPMMLGSASVAAFALLAAWLLPALGPAPGAALAWVLAAGGVTLPATLWLRSRPVVASGDTPGGSP